jgi:hypothetical protein
MHGEQVLKVVVMFVGTSHNVPVVGNSFHGMVEDRRRIIV